MKRQEFLNDTNESIQLALQGFKQSLWTCIPCIVQKVDYTNLTIDAQPTIKGIIENEQGEQQEVNLPLLVDIPLLLPHGGKWHITIPVKENDECLVVFSSRCIDAWWQLGGIQKALEKRMLDLSDGLAILAPYSTPKAKELNTISNNSILIRDIEKKNFFEFTDDGKINILNQSDLQRDTKGNNTINIDGTNTINIKQDSTINIDGSNIVNIKGSCTVNIDGTANITVKGDTMLQSPNTTIDSEVKITKNLTVQGNISGNSSLSIQGSGTVGGDLTASGVSLKSHKHQEQGDGAPTSPPI